MTLTTLPTWVRVLDVDPELGATLEPGELRQATERCLAPSMLLRPGPLPRELLALGRGALGVLVVEGVLTRRVRLGDRRSVELLGPGDLLRPVRRCDDHGLTQSEECWTVQEPGRVAVLDALFQQRTARWPELHGALLDRALRRADALALRLTIAQVPRLGERLELALWHLAERWGRVEPRGVVVPLRLSHQLLADLVCAQRPSVTRALGDLARDDRVVARPAGGWLLRGCPPALGHLADRLLADAVTPVTARPALPGVAHETA